MSNIEMNPRVAINDYDELVAVHRALLELKTITEPFDEAVIGSSMDVVEWQKAGKLIDDLSYMDGL